MKQILPFEVVKKLIEKGGFGNYRLFSLPGENFVAASHLNIDQAQDGQMPTAKLIVDLEENLDLLTETNAITTFLISLKKSSKSPSINEVKYLFSFGDASHNTQQPTIQLQGLSDDKVEQIVTTRVNQLMAAKEAEYQKQRQIDLLVNEISELKRKKYAPKKKGNDLAGLINLGIVAGSAFITKQWPDTKEVVQQALGAISGATDDEEEEEEEETGFSRPE